MILTVNERIKMNRDEQILYLNSTVKCKLGPSKIHGIGVMALFDLPKGTNPHVFPNADPPWLSIPYGNLNKLFPEVKELVLDRWASIINGSHFFSPNDVCWLITFMNHSDEPNYDNQKQVMLKDVKAGEELTEDYRTMLNYDLVYPWLK